MARRAEKPKKKYKKKNKLWPKQKIDYSMTKFPCYLDGKLASLCGTG